MNPASEDPEMRKLRKAIALKEAETEQWRSAAAAHRAGLVRLADWHERNAEDFHCHSNETLHR